VERCPPTAGVAEPVDRVLIIPPRRGEGGPGIRDGSVEHIPLVALAAADVVVYALLGPNDAAYVRIQPRVDVRRDPRFAAFGAEGDVQKNLTSRCRASLPLRWFENLLRPAGAIRG